MPKNLTLTNAVDENLKLVRDEDGTDTPLQLSNDKLKVTGNLTATQVDIGTMASLEDGTNTEGSSFNSEKGLRVILMGELILIR